MLLGLAYHATYAWFPGVAPWYFVADTSPVEALVTVTGFLHCFRMQVFFALSGFFSHLVFERRGPRGYLADRSRRLLVPLLFALPVVLGLDWWLRGQSAALGLMSPAYTQGTGAPASPLHLWFLIYLWVFCAAAWALPAWDGPSKLVRRGLRFPPSLLALAGLTCAGLWVHPETRPDLFFWPRPFELLHFGLFFAFGWWLWPARDALPALQRHAGWLLAAGFGLGLFIFTGGRHWQPGWLTLSGLVTWLMTLGALGLAFGVPSKDRPWLRFLVESSYWVYLVHYPVVLALQLFFAQREGPGWLEYGATTALTFAFALLSFTLLVWKTPLGPWLGVKPRAAP